MVGEIGRPLHARKGFTWDHNEGENHFFLFALNDYACNDLMRERDPLRRWKEKRKARNQHPRVSEVCVS